MKQIPTPRVFAAAAALVVSLLCATAPCHPPKTVELAYDPGERALRVNVAHGVKDPGKHYIKSILVVLNGKQVAQQQYGRQRSEAGHQATFRLGKAGAGDKIEVTAVCAVSGSKSAALVIPAGKPTAAKQAGAARELLTVGTPAPEFKVKDHTGKVVELKQFRGKKNVVLVFYPGDDTPGCTKQLCAIRDDFALFQKADIVAFGVNPQSAVSHKRFVEKFRFPFPLLVDAEEKIVSVYGCKGKLYTTRTVYGIDKQGKIAFAQRGMPKDREILKAFPPTPGS